MSTQSDALARRGGGELATVMPAEMSIEELVARKRKVQQAMKEVMIEGEHYGVIPGTGSKPSLLKPGAETLLTLFMMDPQYVTVKDQDGDHREIQSTCVLFHIPTQLRLGSGMGSCSTREVKYAYRQQARACPSCGKEAIIKGRDEYGGGWLCFKKKDGCGAKFKDGDAAIENQPVGRVDNPDKADQYNTVLKMANKRSLVAAVLNVTGASDIFTQDLEDLPAPERSVSPPAATAPDTGKSAEELFETPSEQRERLTEQGTDAAVLVGRIEGRWAKLRTPAKVQTQQWEKHLGATPFLSHEADPTALSDLLATLGERA
jgi:hypothetical protein